MKIWIALMILPSLSFAAVKTKALHTERVNLQSSKSIQDASPKAKMELAELLNLPLANAKDLILANKSAELYQQLLLKAQSENETMNNRWKAIQLLPLVDAKRATQDLKKLSGDDVWYVKNSALVALNSVDPKKAHEIAYDLLDDKALVVRSAAVEVLQQANEVNRDLVWRELNKEYNFRKGQSLWVRAQIVELLANNPQGKELPKFANLLAETDPRIQAAAVKSLEKIKGTTLGKGSDSIFKKRDLWVAWWKKNSLD